LAAIRKSADDAKRAWSGSNIGYQASVYFADLQPASPEAQFSSEWGLMDRCQRTSLTGVGASWTDKS
jgi:hypothetical protein